MREKHRKRFQKENCTDDGKEEHLERDLEVGGGSKARYCHKQKTSGRQGQSR